MDKKCWLGHFMDKIIELMEREKYQPLQLFSSVNIYHKEWCGCQAIHVTLFKQSTPYKVVYCMCMYVHASVCACIFRYSDSIC